MAGYNSCMFAYGQVNIHNWRIFSFYRKFEAENCLRFPSSIPFHSEDGLVFPSSGRYFSWAFCCHDVMPLDKDIPYVFVKLLIKNLSEYQQINWKWVHIWVCNRPEAARHTQCSEILPALVIDQMTIVGWHRGFLSTCFQEFRRYWDLHIKICGFRILNFFAHAFIYLIFNQN